VNIEQQPSSTAANASACAVMPSKPQITQTIKCEDEVTVTATFECVGSKYTVRFNIETTGCAIYRTIGLWMKWMRKIINGYSLGDAEPGWNNASILNFLKAASLCNRINEVQKAFGSTDALVEQAIEWGRQYGCVYMHAWKHSDEFKIGDCKLEFTLQKWEGKRDIVCVQSAITGSDVESIKQLSDIMARINRQDILMPCLDIVTRAMIFADNVNAYKSSSTHTTDAHRELAKKYESKRMLEHFAEPKVAQWTLMYGGKPSVTLTKQGCMVIGNDFGHTIDSVLMQRIMLDDIAGGPQMWAEIAAFAGKDSPLDTVMNFAKRIGVPMNMDRIKAASAAGKVA
jgi:hypothetical protein